MVLNLKNFVRIILLENVQMIPPPIRIFSPTFTMLELFSIHFVVKLSQSKLLLFVHKHVINLTIGLKNIIINQSINLWQVWTNMMSNFFSLFIYTSSISP